MDDDHKDIHIPLAAVVPQVTRRGATGHNPDAACHQLGDRCHRLERLTYAMIIVNIKIDSLEPQLDKNAG
jgi:hypothetical protein